MEEGHFLGFMITPRGIKENLNKIQAIEYMLSPRSKKGVQSLNGKLATLKGCLSKKDFIWTDEVERAFQDVKAFLKELPALTAPIPGETLTVYLAASSEAISSVLITDRGKTQMPVYFVSKVLQNGELTAYVDSQLVASQLNGSFEARDTSMQKYQELTKALTNTFAAFEIKQIPRNRNKKADALRKLASLLYDHFTKKVMVEVLERKSTEEDTLMAKITTEEECWMTPFIKYLTDGTLPEDKLQAHRIRMRAPMYYFKNGILYRKSFIEPYLRCVGPTQAKEIIREMHEGACSMHSGYRMIFSRIKRMGYFWPHMYQDTYDLIVNCETCQIHAPINRSPRRNMIPIHAAWPFCKWGIDFVGPFPRGVGNVKFLVVAIDYFTKWIEAKPLSTITGRKILIFVWEDIICHFDLPREIANGQVEVTNRDIVADIKARLEFDEQQNDDALRENLDALEEWRTIAHTRQAKKKQQIANHYDKKVKPLDFQLKDLVLRNNEASRQQDVRKLGPRWEGPYRVIGITEYGAYHLETPDGVPIQRPWHAFHLKKYHV
ncbi:uncharacterized protein [Rutidosis leptorrhynchoides]|uniref:uncharacterized protein n=1 Tax=Rutidosis leptorrhynchoides TaxID=125765 RepID=UPI003A9A5214